MTSNDIHASESGFIVSSSPNVNAMYGPWNSVQEAKEALNGNFKTLDDDWNEVSRVPTGTTVAVYDNDEKTLVTEYWWIKNELILKTYGNNYYELVVKNEHNQKVTSVIINDGSIEPKLLKLERIDSSTGLRINLGTVLYSINGTAFRTYSFAEDNEEDGEDELISTQTIQRSISFEWRDDEGRLILFKDLNVIAPPTITQTFYAYNDDEKMWPDYDDGSSTDNYLTYSWAPNTAIGSNTWDVTRKGVSRETPIEWALSRPRINGVWGALMGPSITAAFGKDGSNVTNLLYLWAYTMSINDKENLETNGLSDLGDTLPDTVGSGNTTWYSKFLDLTTDTRYCFVMHRYKLEVNGVLTWSNWTDPALYTALPMDGTDSPTTEYIYCLSETPELGTDLSDELIAINSNCATNTANEQPGNDFNESAYTYWKLDPQGISESCKYEFYAQREKQSISTYETIYGEFGTPKIWTAFGKDGPDGPGVEYIYKLTDSKTGEPEAPESKDTPNYCPDGWSDDPKEVSYAYPKLWMSSRKRSNGVWGDFSEPVLWNQFNLRYDLRLSNENCNIPSAVDGSYTADAAKAATLTEVDLYLGSELVNPDTYTIEADGYDFDDELGKYYFTDLRDIENSIQNTFIAKINGSEVARKNLTIQLSRGLEAYSLQIIPNNRIWYGNNSYSTVNFDLHLYKITTQGVYEEVDSLSDFNYYYLFSNNTTIHKNLYASNHITISGGESSSIYFTLCKGDTVIDTVTISCVDYNKIKGADNVSVLIGGIEKTINIPRSKADNIEYIKTRTKSTPKAYINIIEIPQEKLEVSAELNYIDSITSDPILLELSGNTFWVESALINDASVVYTIKVTMDDGSIQEYIETLHINLTSDTITYDLFSDTDVLMYDESGISQDVINFTVVPSEGEVPAYTLRYWFDNNSYTEEEFEDSPCGFEIPDEIKTLVEGEHVLHFLLYIDDTLKDSLNIKIMSKPKNLGYTYTIDLTNPYLQIPVGISESVLKTWTFNEFSVYQGDNLIEYKEVETEFPRFEVLSTNDNVSIENNTSYLKMIPTQASLITYLIIVHEREGVSYTFTKTLSVQLTNSEAYLIISKPDKVVANYQSSGILRYDPTFNILKDGVISTVGDLYSTDLYYTYDNGEDHTIEELKGYKVIRYNSDTDKVIISLYKKISNTESVLVDLDTIPIIRNGAPGSNGISTKVMYGRCSEYITSETLDNYGTEGTGSGTYITAYTGENPPTEEFSDPLDITWSATPKGITESYTLEFLSVSNYDGTTWSPFSKPTVYSEMGKRGEDGEGILYSFVACLSCTENDGKWTVIVSGQSHSVDLKMGEISEPWLDNIPNLSRENPQLYMISRRKINSAWTDWSPPVLWNTYSSKLELLIDNNIVIVDDDSNADVLKEVSRTNLKAYYLGSEVDLTTTNISVTVGDELDPIITAEQESSDTYYLKLREGEKLGPTSGLITYSITYENITTTVALLVLIKNFSAGTAYKLVLTPNVLSLKYDEGLYKWDSTTILCRIVQIEGSESSYVTDGSVSLKIIHNDEEPEPSYSDTDGCYYYDIPTSGSETPPTFTFLVIKNEVIVDSLTLQGTLQGKNGDPGEAGKSGASFRLRGEWQADAYYCFECDYIETVVDGEKRVTYNYNDGLYIDVVLWYYNGEKKFYQTLQNSTNQNPADVSEYWKEAPGYDTLLSLSILISDGDKISGGMLDTATSSKTILWAGGDGKDTNSSSANAAFRVTEDGTLYATKGMFSGMYISKARELQKFVVSKRIMPELVEYEEYEDNKFRAVTPPILDISELSDVLIFDSSKFDFSDMPKPLCDSNGEIIKYPRYFYEDGNFIREDVDLYISGLPVVYLPTGWSLPIDPSDKYAIPYERLHHFLSVGKSSSIYSETSLSDRVSFRYSNIEFDAFFAYMVSLTTSAELFTPSDISLNSYATTSSFFLKVKEYWDYKYTEALAYKGKSFALKFTYIYGVTMPIIKSLMFETSSSIDVGGNYVSPIEQLAFNKQSEDNYPINTFRVLTCTSIPLEVPNSNGDVLRGYLKEVFDSSSEYHYTNIYDRNDVNEELLIKTRQALAISGIGFTSMNNIEENDITYTESPWGGYIRKQSFTNTAISSDTIYYYEDGDIWWIKENLMYNGYYIPYQCCVAYPQDPSKNFSMPYINAPYRYSGEFITWNLTSAEGTDFQLRYTPVDEITVDCEFNQKKEAT